MQTATEYEMLIYWPLLLITGHYEHITGHFEHITGHFEYITVQVASILSCDSFWRAFYSIGGKGGRLGHQAESGPQGAPIDHEIE